MSARYMVALTLAVAGLALIFWPPLNASVDMTSRRMVGAVALLIGSWTIIERAD